MKPDYPRMYEAEASAPLRVLRDLHDQANIVAGELKAVLKRADRLLDDITERYGHQEKSLEEAKKHAAELDCTLKGISDPMLRVENKAELLELGPRAFHWSDDGWLSIPLPHPNEERPTILRICPAGHDPDDMGKRGSVCSLAGTWDAPTITLPLQAPGWCGWLQDGRLIPFNP